jgi:IS30 family transposase
VTRDTIGFRSPPREGRPCTQITFAERYALAALHGQGLSAAAIGRALSRDRSTITRELRRNATRNDGYYRAPLADGYARGRRSLSRRNRRLTLEDLVLIAACVWAPWSPEQTAGWLRRHGILRVSHETIYRFIAADRAQGGALHTQLRCRRRRRKHYGTREWRGRVHGKRPIGTRPAIVEGRTQVGHWEADTLLGVGRPCLLSLVERKTGFVVLGKLETRTSTVVNRRAVQVIRRQRHRVRTITADNGTEFHSSAAIERATQTRFFFATPHHAWERGTNENTNGLLRQYLPKGCDMTEVTHNDCEGIAAVLNDRPRKRLDLRTPEECYATR